MWETIKRTMLIKEYRIPLPLTVEEYRIAQLYMIAVSRYLPHFFLSRNITLNRVGKLIQSCIPYIHILHVLVHPTIHKLLMHKFIIRVQWHTLASFLSPSSIEKEPWWEQRCGQRSGNSNQWTVWRWAGWRRTIHTENLSHWQPFARLDKRY